MLISPINITNSNNKIHKKTSVHSNFINNSASDISFKGAIISENDKGYIEDLLKLQDISEAVPANELYNFTKYGYNRHNIKILNKICESESLRNSKNVQKYIGNILLNTFEKRTQILRSAIIDKLLSDEKIYKNESVMDSAGEIIAFTISKNILEAKSEVIDKLVQDNDFYNQNKDKAGELLKYAYTAKRFSSKIKIAIYDIKQFFSDLF